MHIRCAWVDGWPSTKEFLDILSLSPIWIKNKQKAGIKLLLQRIVPHLKFILQRIVPQLKFILQIIVPHLKFIL